MEKIVLLDASFLMACAEFKVDYFSEFDRIFSFACRPAVFDAVVDELSRLKIAGDFKKKQSSRLALEILGKKNVEVLRSEKKSVVDDLFVDFAGADYVVATIDAGLKSRLKKKGIAVVVIRKKKYLELIVC